MSLEISYHIQLCIKELLIAALKLGHELQRIHVNPDRIYIPMRGGSLAVNVDMNKAHFSTSSSSTTQQYARLLLEWCRIVDDYNSAERSAEYPAEYPAEC